MKVYQLTKEQKKLQKTTWNLMKHKVIVDAILKNYKEREIKD